MKTSKHLGFSFLLIFIFFASHPSAANDSLLQWQPNTEPDLKGYNVYCGTQSRAYGPPISIGNTTEYLYANLQSGKTYFFAVTAVDKVGNESGYSSETYITIPEPDSTVVEPPIATSDDDITLSADAFKIKGDKFANLSWLGASSEYIDVYRNGSLVSDGAGIPNDGEYLHGPFNSGKPATYQVCTKGTSVCSNEITLSW